MLGPRRLEEERKSIRYSKNLKNYFLWWKLHFFLKIATGNFECPPSSFRAEGTVFPFEHFFKGFPKNARHGGTHL